MSDQVSPWKVGGGGSPNVAPQNKIPHLSAQRQTDSMSDAQKRGVQAYNLMRQTLLDNGLMEDK